MSTNEPWVDIDEAASFLNVNKETIRRWIKALVPPSQKAGKLLRFKLSEIDTWVRTDNG